jgi:hypothetical protein
MTARSKRRPTLATHQWRRRAFRELLAYRSFVASNSFRKYANIMQPRAPLKTPKLTLIRFAEPRMNPAALVMPLTYAPMINRVFMSSPYQKINKLSRQRVALGEPSGTD